jgi:hypothetical protein
MSNINATLPASAGRLTNGRFGPGNPGRRAGARSRISHRAVMAILQDFELHRGEVLDRLRQYHAPTYFALLLKILDRELEAEAPAFDDYSEPELARMVLVARSTLNGYQDPRTALIELESALVNQTSVDPSEAAHRING